MPTFSPDRTADNLASQLRKLRRSQRAQRTLVEGSARQLALVAFAVPAVALVTLIVVMLTVLLMAGSGLTGVPSAIASGWLAMHQVPVTVSGVTIGVLPLLPTLLVAVGTAWLCARAVGGDAQRAAHDLFDTAAVVFSAVIGPVLITAMSLAIVMDGGSVLPIQTPNALVAFGYTIALHTGAALAGVAWSRRHDFADRWGLTRADRRGFRHGLIALLMLLVSGAVLVCVRLIMGHEQMGLLIESGYDFDGYLGLSLLSLLYLPNTIVGATSVLIGSDVHLGAMSVDLFTVREGQLPPVPILAVLPEGPGAGTWGLVGLIVPAVVAAAVAWRCRNLDPLAHVRSIGVAAAVTASAMVVLAVASGGRLGEFGDVAVTVSAVGVFTLGWMAVVGLLVALVHAFLPSTRGARAALGDAWFDDSDLGFEDEYVIVADLDDEDEYVDYTDYDETDYDETDYDETGYGETGYGETGYEDSDSAETGYEEAGHDGTGHEDSDAAQHSGTQYLGTQYPEDGYDTTARARTDSAGDTEYADHDRPIR